MSASFLLLWLLLCWCGSTGTSRYDREGLVGAKAIVDVVVAAAAAAVAVAVAVALVFVVPVLVMFWCITSVCKKALLQQPALAETVAVNDNNKQNRNTFLGKHR